MRLAGKVAAITGAGAGIGRAIALRFAREGARVAVSDRDGEAAQRVAAQIREAGGSALHAPCDVSDEAAVQAFVDRVVAEHGALDVMVNNAAFVRHAALAETTTKAWKKSLEVTLDGTFYGLRAALQVMLARQGGVILNITSGAGLGGEPYHNAYGAAKAAVHNLTQLACVESAGSGVRVNAICPGPIDTDSLRAALAQRSGGLERFLDQVPARRLGLAEEIASAAAFLASDEAAYIHGAILTVDGGISARTGAPR
jgi:meso-butanediol dehydrogenase / (S,S)-butanediol dehydrogenase / diacetyl reductase